MLPPQDNVVSKGRPPTMRDVAALAGVSLKTVSRVVNGEPQVSPELAARVVEAVEKLGYRHNLTASTLRRSDQRSETIGLLLDDVSNPFSSTIHRAIEQVAQQRNTLVFAGSSGEPERERELLSAMVSRNVDGFVVVPASGDHSGLQHERRLGRPIVFLDRVASFPGADAVTADNREGARLAVRHLAGSGHLRIGFLGDLREIWTAEERYLGYLEALSLERLQLEPELVRRDLHSIAAADDAAMELLTSADPPTALFTGQNLITIGAVQALQRLDLQRSVALVGFDDVLLADLLDPPVSVMAQDPAELGRAAAELLFARLDGDRSPARTVVVPTRLIRRGSGELAAPGSPAEVTAG
jgi:LacI family transcriptional regulator